MVISCGINGSVTHIMKDKEFNPFSESRRKVSRVSTITFDEDSQMFFITLLKVRDILIDNRVVTGDFIYEVIGDKRFKDHGNVVIYSRTYEDAVSLEVMIYNELLGKTREELTKIAA
jgi:hypothetical protein